MQFGRGPNRSFVRRAVGGLGRHGGLERCGMVRVIAHVGDFSVDNYGDQLYPEVVSGLLRDCGFDGHIEYFAPLEGRTPGGQRIRPLRELARVHPDAVLVGGGDLIRTDIGTIAKDHLNIPSGRRGSRLSRVRGRLFRMRSFPAGAGPWLPRLGWGDAPTAFVSVGVHELAPSEDVRAAVSHISSAWVRTAVGRDRLQEVGMDEQLTVAAPDAVFATAAFRDPDPLRARGRQLLRQRWGVDRAPIVVQAAEFHGWSPDRISAVVRSLKPLPVVNLPLGRYAGEDQVLKAVAQQEQVPVLTNLKAAEITDVLAAAGAVFTTSMHAAIVGTCVGTPVVVPKIAKTADALAACPEPPVVHLAADGDVAGIVADVYGERHQLPSRANATACQSAFSRTMEHVGL